MTTKEINAQLKTLKIVFKKITSSKKASQDFLIRAGIHTKSGRVTKAYK